MTLRGGLNVVTGIVSQGQSVKDCGTTPNLEFEAVDVFQHLSWISSIAGIGLRDDQPVDAVPADYDVDGAIDLAVKTSAGDWKIDFANNGFGFWDVVYSGYGFSDAHAVPADYDRDFKADLSVKSDDGMWFIDYAATASAAGMLHTQGTAFQMVTRSRQTMMGTLRLILVSNRMTACGSLTMHQWLRQLGCCISQGTAFQMLTRSRQIIVWTVGLILVSSRMAARGSLTVVQTASAAWNVAFSGYGFSDGHPVPADYDGDGRADLSVKSDGGVWFIDYSVNGFGSWDVVFSGWGDSNVRAVPGDYDRDHRLDLAVYSLLNDSWYIDYAENGFGGLNAVISEAP